MRPQFVSSLDSRRYIFNALPPFNEDTVLEVERVEIPSYTFSCENFPTTLLSYHVTYIS